MLPSPSPFLPLAVGHTRPTAIGVLSATLFVPLVRAVARSVATRPTVPGSSGPTGVPAVVRVASATSPRSLR